MSVILPVMDEGTTAMSELKRRLKLWETQFSKDNGRKPNKVDLNSSDEMRSVYKKYWKLQNDKKLVTDKEKTQEIDFWAQGDRRDTNKTRETMHGNVKKSTAGGLALKLWKNSQKISAAATVAPSKTSKPCISLQSSVESKIQKRTLEIEKESNDISTDVDRPAEFSDLKKKFSIFTDNRLKKPADLKPVNCFSGVVTGNSKRTIKSVKKVNLDWLNSCSREERSNELSFDKGSENATDRKPTSTEDYRSLQSVNRPKSAEFNVARDSSNVSESSEDCVRTVERTNSARTSKEKVLDSRDCRENTETNCVSDEAGEHTQTNSDVPTSVFDFVEETHKSTSSLKPEIKAVKAKRKLSNSSSEITKKPKKTKTASPELENDGTEPQKKKTSKKGSAVSENYVRINMKKKVFVRGAKKSNLAKKYKRAKWKNHQRNKCFKCGEQGHWATNCPQNTEGLDQMVIDKDPDVPSNLEVDEPSDSAVLTSNCFNCGGIGHWSKYCLKKKDQNSETKGTETEVEQAPLTFSQPLPTVEPKTVESFYELNEDQKTIGATALVLDALHRIGHKSFKPYQEAAVMRVLSGISTLLILPTGSGKSLCYQLPAMIYKERSNCISLVVSPLVSLMEDQAKFCVDSVFLHSGMTTVQRQKSMDLIKEGSASVLLLSPEFLLSSHEYLSSFMPPVAFVCIDEVHCLSEWSHNFRPSYLQLLKVIREMGVKCILGLTATATKESVTKVVQHLELSEEGILGRTSIPKNLQLSVSVEEDKDDSLLRLLQGQRFEDMNSVIIYCTRREETERLATLIRIKLQCMATNATTEIKGKKKVVNNSIDMIAAAYHAGLTPSQRRTVQKRFMTGKLRIVVATVAFGMGLNKSDVRGIVHYNMPKSFENYVQEIGRAGRDGLHAHCHVFLNPDGDDLLELRRHVYSNGVDRHTLRKLLSRIFPGCSCKQHNKVCEGHEAAVPVEQTVQALDLKEENITTLLCYLQLHPKRWLDLKQKTFAMCSVQSYKGHEQLLKAAQVCEPLGVGFDIAKENDDLQPKSSKVKFDYIEACDRKNWNSRLVRRSLKQLEFATIAGRVRKSGLVVDFSDLSFLVKQRGHLQDSERDEILDYLHDRVTKLERKEILKLQNVFQTFKSLSEEHKEPCYDEVNADLSDKLKEILSEYFNSEEYDYTQYIKDFTIKNGEIEQLRSDIRNLLDIHHEHRFTGRQVANIFYGIGSPCFPTEVWGRVRRFWRSHMDFDFPLLMAAANKEIAQSRIN